LSVPNVNGVYSTAAPPGKLARAGGSSFSQVLTQTMNRPTPYEKWFEQAGSSYNIAPALLKAIAMAESNFNPAAVSGAGAVGLMQFMPATAQGLGINPRDPGQSIMGAGQYLRSLLDRFGNNVQLAVAAYNAGPGAVEKYNGIPPYQETRNYVKRITGLINEFGGSGNPDDITVSDPMTTTANISNNSNRLTSDDSTQLLSDLLLVMNQYELLSNLNGDQKA
jgi:hypothetical protein